MPDSQLRFEAGYSVREYDELRVAYDPQEPVSNRQRTTLELSYELEIDPTLPFCRRRAAQGMAGVRAEWR